jgi:hypothetical protein
MSLSASQQRALDQIEKTLANDHPGLGPIFSIFTRLTGHEAMPMTERVTDRRWWRRMQPTVAALVGLAVAAGVLLSLSLTLPSPATCPSAGAQAAAYTRPVPTGRPPACAPQQVRPSATNQSGHDAP